MGVVAEGYTRHNWSTDEPIAAEKLNYIEDGVSSLYGGNYPTSLIIDDNYNETTEVHTLNKIWDEIHENFINGVHCVIRYSGNYPSLVRIRGVFIDNLGEYDNAYVVNVNPEASTTNVYTAPSSEGYPVGSQLSPK